MIILVSTLFFMGIWIIFQKYSWISRIAYPLFIISFLGLLFSFFIVKGGITNNLMSLSATLLGLGVVSALLIITRGNKFVQLFILTAGLLIAKNIKQFPKIDPPVDKRQISFEAGQVNIDPHNELLILLEEDATLEDIRPILDEYDITTSQPFHPRQEDLTDLDEYYALNIPVERESQFHEIYEKLNFSESLAWLEYNDLMKIEPIESITKIGRGISAAINDPMASQQWSHEMLRTTEYYRYLSRASIKPQKKAKLFILDSGVAADHEDLKDVYESFDEDYDEDTNGHGTHCAGIAAATTNNRIGIASFNANSDWVSISSIKVINFWGFATQTAVIEAMIKASDNGADVISLSLGGLSNQLKEEAYDEAVEYVNSQGTIVVVAAGNASKNAKNYSPANAANTITVSAINDKGEKAYFSNVVNEVSFPIAAPGENIMSTYLNDSYKALNGTSMATPYVSGLVAMMKAINPDLTTEEVHTILQDTGMETANTLETGRLIYPAEAIKAISKKELLF